jgi:hypothetical protein
MEAILEMIPGYLTILSTICGAVTIALVGGIAIWTFRDIRSRSRDFLAWILATLLVLVLPVVGLVVYFMLRPQETLAEAYEHSLEQEALLQAIEEPETCPGCGQRVKREYLICPTCHTRLKQACPQCGQALHMRWAVCPYCAANVGQQVLEPVPTTSGAQASEAPSFEQPAELGLETQRMFAADEDAGS